ncbi:MAG: yrrB 1 [Myxococcaceae bacterium]|nr:yrrB 1 [Myxococcaceae bacterium]
MLLLLALVLAQSPGAMLQKVDRQEDLNDLLEEHFDAVCGALKSGQRSLGPALTDPDAHPALKEIVWASACSLRALKLQGTGKKRTVHFLWEVEGRDATGARLSERGEADGEVRQEKGQWRISAFRDGPRQTVRREGPRFVERAQEAGLVLPPRTEEQTMAELQSGGLTVRDFDGDGRPDVVALDGRRAWLFRNAKAGFGREPLLEAPKGKVLTSAIAGDFDEDGDPDLVVTAFRDVASWVFRNDSGKLVEVGRLAPGGRLQSGVASDFDSDGHLDLVLLSYPLGTTLPSDPLKAENGDPLVFLKGNGKLGFAAWPQLAKGLTHRWSLAAMSVDLLGQGRPQLYVANDFGDNDLWRFQSDGGVQNVAAEYGLADPGNGMSVDVGDLDNDGRMDLYVANMFSKAGTRVLAGASTKPEVMARLQKFARGNTLYFSESDGGYVEAAQALGVNRGLWAWGSLVADLDDDGRLEVAVANGFYSHPKRKDL